MQSWDALIGGRGPDHFLELVFDRDVRPRVRGLDTTGFVRSAQVGPMACGFRGEVAGDGYDLYVDAAHHDAVVANLVGPDGANVWVYETIMVGGGVGGGRIWVEHGYGSASADARAVEARVLALATAAGAGLVAWSIEYGGQGYPGGVVAAGTSGAELASALSSATS